VSDYRFVREARNGAEFREVTEGQVVVTPRDEHSEALKYIGSAGYAGISFAALCDELRKGLVPDLDERMVMHMIVRLWRSGFLDVALQRAPIAIRTEGCARISEVARYQATRDEGAVIALQHRSCKISALERQILAMCDGKRTFGEIRSAVGVEGRESATSDALARLVELGFFAD
jgi:hypothetical protein